MRPVRAVTLAAAVALALGGLVLALSVIVAPGVELNPFEASPEDPTVTFLTGLGLVFVSLLLAPRALRTA